MANPISDARLTEIKAAVDAHGWKEASRILGLHPRTIREHLVTHARRGLNGTAPVQPGFEIAKISTAQDETGNVLRTYVTQRAERGGDFVVPETHQVRGLSALVDADGKVIQQWIKTREGDNSQLLVEVIRAAFDAYLDKRELIEPPTHADDQLATVYAIGDHHLGMYSWGKETGTDYDLRVGEKTLLDAMALLVGNAPSAYTAVVLNLGDFFHSDSSNNQTTSGHALDVDTRYGKVLQVGIKILVACIELALQKHKQVIVRCLPGNHDPHTSLALSAALAAFFHANPRVEIDCDPGKFWYWQFGRVFLAATHGDMVKPDRMPGVMAATQPEKWGSTSYRYAYFGHVHHSSKLGGEQFGVVCETFQTLSAKDAWHAAMGYTGGRSMVAITHHKDYGEVLRHTVSVNQLEKARG